jgi:hypothetical protein
MPSGTPKPPSPPPEGDGRSGRVGEWFWLGGRGAQMGQVGTRARGRVGERWWAARSAGAPDHEPP